ncbi:MAG: ComF family protein [Candidatus Saganbacteria bacterium]|nr:ComF family protein [Candidatus Saganbacteria bacterium]
MNKFIVALFDILFPPKCLICRRADPHLICPDCRSKIEFIRKPFCKICGKPADKYFKGDICNDCFSITRPFTLARSVGLYRGPLKTAIHKFKFKNKRSLAPVLAELTIDHLKTGDIDVGKIDLIHSVPLSSRRMKDRGYNQVDLICEPISSHYKIPLEKGIIIRRKETKPQFDLPREKRFENVKDAFIVNDNRPIIGKSVLLVDDIYTTGATVEECSKALREAGAKDIYVLTLSRAADR